MRWHKFTAKKQRFQWFERRNPENHTRFSLRIRFCETKCSCHSNDAQSNRFNSFNRWQQITKFNKISHPNYTFYAAKQSAQQHPTEEIQSKRHDLKLTSHNVDDGEWGETTVSMGTDMLCKVGAVCFVEYAHQQYSIHPKCRRSDCRLFGQNKHVEPCDMIATNIYMISTLKSLMS